jgi:hypothetical protein
MWQIKVSDEYERRLKRFSKIRPNEVTFTLVNLAFFESALNEGAAPQDIRVSFVHAEPGGVLAITERGAGKNATPLRLYVYPDDALRTLYLITLGDKKTQRDDIQFCKKSLEFIRSEGRKTDG